MLSLYERTADVDSKSDENILDNNDEEVRVMRKVFFIVWTTNEQKLVSL